MPSRRGTSCSSTPSSPAARSAASTPQGSRGRSGVASSPTSGAGNVLAGLRTGSRDSKQQQRGNVTPSREKARGAANNGHQPIRQSAKNLRSPGPSSGPLPMRCRAPAQIPVSRRGRPADNSVTRTTKDQDRGSASHAAPDMKESLQSSKSDTVVASTMEQPDVGEPEVERPPAGSLLYSAVRQDSRPEVVCAESPRSLSPRPHSRERFVSAVIRPGDSRCNGQGDVTQALGAERDRGVQHGGQTSQVEDQLEASSSRVKALERALSEATLERDRLQAQIRQSSHTEPATRIKEFEQALALELKHFTEERARLEQLCSEIVGLLSKGQSTSAGGETTMCCRSVAEVTTAALERQPSPCVLRVGPAQVLPPSIQTPHSSTSAPATHVIAGRAGASVRSPLAESRAASPLPSPLQVPTLLQTPCRESRRMAHSPQRSPSPSPSALARSPMAPSPLPRRSLPAAYPAAVAAAAASIPGFPVPSSPHGCGQQHPYPFCTASPCPSITRMPSWVTASSRALEAVSAGVCLDHHRHLATSMSQAFLDGCTPAGHVDRETWPRFPMAAPPFTAKTRLDPSAQRTFPQRTWTS
mmetsp:Transcript_27176/g.63224  ORF Transcript_27176/g.63224 Transcript_27176/m.63224 type:complete len:585 (-) Transcript_27176:309-2063(-)